MSEITMSFATKPLEACISLTRTMDKRCFPEEMWLGNEEIALLLKHDAEATILIYNGIEIGQAITLPEQAAAAILEGVDEKFTAKSSGVYSYSEAILPEYQNQGYGGLLLCEMAIRMRNRGYQSISAHVRTRYGWNRRRTQSLQMLSHRLIFDFWNDPREVVEYQEARL